MRRRATRVDDPLRDPLVVEVRDLLAQDEVLEQRRPAETGLQRRLVVGDGDALVRRHALSGRIGANAIKRRAARAGARCRCPSGLVVRRVFGQRASGHQRRRRLDLRAFVRVLRVIDGILAGLLFVQWQRLGGCIGFAQLPINGRKTGAIRFVGAWSARLVSHGTLRSREAGGERGIVCPVSPMPSRRGGVHGADAPGGPVISRTGMMTPDA